MNYPKRLIEVDLPIKRISAHSRREKSIRHGHISSLHIWWARRPLAACRAIICAALWPDPADPICPTAFLDAAREVMQKWTTYERQTLLSEESRRSFDAARKNPALFDDPLKLRHALLDFIADFSNWDNSSVKEYLETSHALTQAAHEALGGHVGTIPLVVDPFAGGGSISLEALRVGADAFASDLNPIPVLLNKVVLEYIPKYGQRLADEVRKWGEWIKREAEKELAEFYPKDADGAIPIAYLWARTIQCEGPGCGAIVPLIRTNSLFSKGQKRFSLCPILDKDKKNITFKVVKEASHFSTIKSAAVTCPLCGYTTPSKRVMAQVTSKYGGALDAILLAVVSESSEFGRRYKDYRATTVASEETLSKRLACLAGAGEMPPTVNVNPNRPSPNARGLSAVTRYGMSEFRYLYSLRQQITLLTIRKLVREATEKAGLELGVALGSCLTLAFGRLVDRNSTLCRWIPQTGAVGYTFGRQALSMIWDYAEINPLVHSGGWTGGLEDIARMIENHLCLRVPGQAEQVSATQHSLVDDCVNALITDPPYYDAIPYADLSDFFYVWLRPLLAKLHPSLAIDEITPKEEEAIWNPGRRLKNGKPKDEAFYEAQMQKALIEGRRITMPTGVGVVVFAHKSTAGWEALLTGMLQAGWIVTASWPIDTERETRTNAIGTASLASSVHLVCRPRENLDGSVRTDEIGDWRDVLAELPRRIHEWMPRLAEEGVVGADAIFACLGPALEIFSRYSRVEKASGETVSLNEYLVQVWAAVAKEALAQVFKDADTAGFEPDARLTAMWLWTLNAGTISGSESENNETDEEEEESKGKGAKAKGGFVLEYDAARKIAQGLGANLEDLTHVIEVAGESARLLPVSERTRYLFGKDEAQAPAPKSKKKAPQMDLFAELSQSDNSEAAWGEKMVQRVGETTLDRIHQAMILFAAGRGEALKRFLVEDGAGWDGRFWRLAQALSALYSASSSEKRWVDGVLARKKGLGL